MRGWMLLSCGLLVVACGSPDEPQPSMHEVAFELRERIRKSPDHLRARAKDVVAGKNAQAIYEFVRDQIITLPPADDSLEAFSTTIRWGTPGTLRSGAGTPREHVDLLVELYTRAGLSARVMQCAPHATRIAFRDVFLRSFERTFAPDVTHEELERYGKILGSTDGSGVILDADGQARRALAERLLVASSGRGDGRSFTWELPPSIPLVEIMVDGVVTYATPWLPQGRFGESYCQSPPTQELVTAVAPMVKVTLTARSLDESAEETVLVEHSWSADQVVGQEVWVQFFSGLDPLHHLLAPLSASRSFTPALVLRGKADEAKPVTEMITGTAFTSTADLLTQDDEGNISINGVLMGDGERSPEDEGRVASLDLSVDGRSFPLVKLSVDALDAAGVSVTGLAARSFNVFEDGMLTSARLHHNTSSPPRVLFLVDKSGSVPLEFQGENLAELGRQLVQRIRPNAPGAEFNACGVQSGGCYLSDDWTQDATVLGDRLKNVWSYGSDLWESLARSMTVGATVVVFITDGDATDELTAWKAMIEGGVPTVTVGVGSVKEETLEKISELTGGVSVSVQSTAAAANAVVEFVGEHHPDPYRLVYRANLDGASTRVVRVEIKERPITTSGSYDVPASTKPMGFGGLWLTVEVDGRKVTRTLAGLGPAAVGQLATQTDVDEVLAQYFGNAFVSFSGFGATLAQWFDELITARLSLEPLLEALASDDLEVMLDGLAVGYIPYSGKVELVQAPLPNALTETTLTFPTGLRAVLMTQSPRFGVGMSSKLDILPITSWHTVADDADLAWTTTLDRTATLALAEANAYGTNTISLTQDYNLVPAMHGSVATTLEAGGATSELAARFDRAAQDLGSDAFYLLPDTPNAGAFWAIDIRSGAVLGLLPDGSGGSSAICESDDLSRDMAALSLLNNLAGLMGMPPGLGGIISLSIAIQTAILRDALIVSVLPPSGISSDDFDRLLDAAKGDVNGIRNVLLRAAGGAVPGGGGPTTADSTKEDLSVLFKPPPEGC
ncbi:MAG: hypothetical protein JRH20_23255 [Deltaproteobacteria bacterium]|nr:hypothetical protein [Deltaproteobacteria bacterium]